MTQTRGTCLLITGDGKGKTSASIGLMIRAIGAGRVATLVAFDKASSADPERDSQFSSERAVLRRLPEANIFSYGRCRMSADGCFDFENTSEDYEQARAALKKAYELVVTTNQEGLIVCDEILSCIGSGLLQRADILALVQAYHDTTCQADLVLTGRGGLWQELVELADIVSDIQCVKHCFNQGVPARKGLDY